MKKNSKLTILSILTSTVVLTSSALVDTTTNRYISSYYDVLINDITSEYELIDEDVNFVPEDNYVPQGIALVDDYIITSSYEFYKDKNSIICVYDKSGVLVNKCLLDHKAHVGGIAYDSQNQLLWVSTYCGNISAYNITDILTKDKVYPKYKDMDVGHKLPSYSYPWLNSVSFLTIYNNELFVGNFSLRDDGRIKKYSIEEKDNQMCLRYNGFFEIPNKVQGVTFYKKDDREYILFSRSFGRKSPSLLQIFRYKNNITNYRDNDLVSTSLRLSPMLEQIVCTDNEIYGVYESNAKPYISTQDSLFDSVPAIKADSLIKKLELKIDTS